MEYKANLAGVDVVVTLPDNIPVDLTGVQLNFKIENEAEFRHMVAFFGGPEQFYLSGGSHQGRFPRPADEGDMPVQVWLALSEALMPKAPVAPVVERVKAELARQREAAAREQAAEWVKGNG